MTRQAISTPLFFVAVTSALIIVLVRHRDLVERDRQVELAQANLIVENSPVVLFRWKAAEGWPVEWVSRNVVQFGYAPEELFSGAVLYSSMVHPQDLTRVAREVREYSDRGADHFQQEYRLVTKDGKARWVDDRTVIERDAEGRITHYQGIVIDITERKLAEVALQESERRYRTLAEISPVGIFRTDYQGQTTYVNPRWSEISGLEASKALGAGWLHAVHPQDREQLATGWQEAALAQSVSRAE
jgi:PAS domain S-box-containing protein